MFGLHNDAIARRHERHGRQSDASFEALAACVLSGSYVGERTTIRRRVHSSTKFRAALAIWMRPCLDDPTGQVWFAVVRDCLQVIRLPHPPPVLPSCRRSDVSMMALQTSDKGVLCQQDPAISRPETRVETHVSLYTLACHRRDSNPSLGRCGASGRRAAF